MKVDYDYNPDLFYRVNGEQKYYVEFLSHSKHYKWIGVGDNISLILIKLSKIIGIDITFVSWCRIYKFNEKENTYKIIEEFRV